MRQLTTASAFFLRSGPALTAAALTAAALLGAGCSTHQTTAEHPVNPALRAITPPAHGTAADADRAALARFVGVWNFEGWSTDPTGAHQPGAGHAAAVIESEHFVLMDLLTTSGQLAGRTSRKSGSMIFASEPGIGVTMTAWGDASPSISRMVGRAEGNGSVFTFHEAKTPEGHHQMGAIVTFETDDRWVVDIKNASMSGEPVVARYTFTRVR